MEKTLFISFEGIDGSGKDTQLLKLVEAIKKDDDYPFGNKYSHIWIARNPSKLTKPGREIARKIREGEVSKEEATRLFIEDRKEHTDIIKQVLKHSHVLISRYDLSTLSYQMTQGMDFGELYDAHMFNKEGGCIVPDITLVFKLPAEVALKRSQDRGEAPEFYEKKEFQERLAENLVFAMNKLRETDGRLIIEIDANQSIEEVTKEMLEKLYIHMEKFKD